MAELRQWHGLISDADPHDIPEGAATEAENFSLSVPGKLKVRGGLQPITYSPAITAVYDILAMYGWRPTAGSRAVYLDTNGDVYAGNLSSGTTPYETGVDVTKPPSWAETRQGTLIRVDGEDRGTIYDGTTLYPLGITAPTSGPTVLTPGSGGATVGDYVCAYRWKDAAGNYSALSPLTTVTAAALDRFNWTVIGTTAQARVTTVELFRSTANQSTTLYLIHSMSDATTVYDNDTETDDEVAANTALPILNPDNSLNARKQVPPPEDYEIICPFQDRMFYARPATMTTTNRNKILYSEVDEPESVPSTQNVVIVQENTDDNDRITALMPHGSTLWIMKDRHAYRANFVRQPNIDMIPTLAHSRGCVNKLCWAFYGDVAFIMDRFGPWAMSRAGKQEIGDEVRNYFRDNLIDFSKSAWFFVRVEPNEAVVRFYVSLSGQSGNQPKTALCFSIRTQAWTVERYPHGLGGGCRIDASNALRCLVGGENGKSLLVNEGVSDIVSTAVTGTHTSTQEAGAYDGLVDTAASFVAGEVGASLIITGGTGAGQMRTIKTRTSGTVLVMDANWTTNPDATSTYAIGGIYAFYKTGIFAIPYEENSQRVFALTYLPTTSDQYVELEVFYDHNTAAEEMKASEVHPEGFDSTAGSTRLRRNLKSLRSVLGTAPGFAMHELTMRTEPRAITNRYVAAKLTAYQATEAVTLFGLEVAGV